MRLQVDFTLIGTPRSGVRVTVFLLGAERGRIQTGDRVGLVGDTVPNYEAKVTEVLSDPA